MIIGRKWAIQVTFCNRQSSFVRDIIFYTILNVSARGNIGWSNDDVMRYFIKSENANLTTAEVNYHGYDGLMSVTDVPYRTPIADAFVNAGAQIGLPVIDLNGEKQIGINYIQVNNSEVDTSEMPVKVYMVISSITIISYMGLL